MVPIQNHMSGLIRPYIQTAAPRPLWGGSFNNRYTVRLEALHTKVAPVTTKAKGPFPRLPLRVPRSELRGTLF